MKFQFMKIVGLLFISLSIHFTTVKACSTFKLQKGQQLIYGHNLNQGDIGVPGLIFINKRGIFKTGRTWDELATKEKKNPSDLCWISRYGSVTFNNFGKDFPDGGMNEAGLYIWEMNAETEYPKCDSLPKLNQMQWMQYILDNFTTLDEAIDCAHNITIDGWGWHFFVGDSKGNTAAIEFIDGRVIVHSGKDMPIPALFNSYYEREMELMKYYEGFGGLYKVDMDSPYVPRFVKTAQLIKDYNPSKNIIDYSFRMLEQIKVFDEPEWSIVFDIEQMAVYFRTRECPEIKNIYFNQLDFSNSNPTQILNIDIKSEGNVAGLLEKYSNEKMKEFIVQSLIPIMPEKFFTREGISIDEYVERVSSHTDKAKQIINQYFNGIWKNKTNSDEEVVFTLELNTKDDSVIGFLWNSKKPTKFHVDHSSLLADKLSGTFRTKKDRLIEIKGEIKEEAMSLSLADADKNLGSYILFKQYEK